MIKSAFLLGGGDDFLPVGVALLGVRALSGQAERADGAQGAAACDARGLVISGHACLLC